MKVKCIKLLGLNRNIVESSNWLEIGAVYHVITIYIDLFKGVSYRIINSDSDSIVSGMGIQDASAFEIVSDVIPASWKVKVLKNTAITISPLAWQKNGWWEAFYEDDPVAHTEFEREYNLILAEDP